MRLGSDSASGNGSSGGVRRLLHLDVLRGLAILLVLGRHFPKEMSADSSMFLAIWHRVGWVGVDLFFVLSGFLVGGLLFGEFQRRGEIDIRRFLIRRSFKIWPSYAAYLAVAGLLLFLLEVPGNAAERGWETFRALRANLLHIQNYAGTRYSHTWSLAVEEHFYLALPLLLLCMLWIRRRATDNTQNFRFVPALFLTVAVLCLAGRVLAAWHWSQFSWRLHMAPTHLRIDSLFGGVCLAYFATFYRDQLLTLQRLRLWMLFCGTICFAPALFLDVEATPFVYTFGLSFLILGSMALVCWAWLKGQQEQKGEANPGLQVIGQMGIYSYSIYLWHAPYCQELSVPLAQMLGVSSTVVLLAIYLAIAIVPGIVLFGLIEKPALALRNRWFADVMVRKPTDTPALPLRAAA